MVPEQLRRRWPHARHVCFSKGWKALSATKGLESHLAEPMPRIWRRRQGRRLGSSGLELFDVYEKYSKGWKAQLQTLGQGVAKAKTTAAEEAEQPKP